MAIDRRQNQAIGCAYYIASEEKLCCLQDIAQGDLDVLETGNSLPNGRKGSSNIFQSRWTFSPPFSCSRLEWTRMVVTNPSRKDCSVAALSLGTVCRSNSIHSFTD